jgi:uncharacterized protein YqeY
LNSAILYAEVGAGKRDEGLDEREEIALLQKEAKKRAESVELYAKGGNQEKADAEATEIRVIEKYLPAQLSDEELAKLVDQAIGDLKEVTPQSMGKVIGRVKQLSEGQADGARVAAAVKERIQK